MNFKASKSRGEGERKKEEEAGVFAMGVGLMDKGLPLD